MLQSKRTPITFEAADLIGYYWKSDETGLIYKIINADSVNKLTMQRLDTNAIYVWEANNVLEGDGELYRQMPVVVIGKRHFERVNGNTYHSVTVYFDDGTNVYIPRRYGYGNAYRDTAKQWLQDNGHTIPETIQYDAIDVQRKRDL